MPIAPTFIGLNRHWEVGVADDKDNRKVGLWVVQVQGHTGLPGFTKVNWVQIGRLS
jgi:hypothetical protein